MIRAWLILKKKVCTELHLCLGQCHNTGVINNESVYSTSLLYFHCVAFIVCKIYREVYICEILSFFRALLRLVNEVGFPKL